MFSLKILGARFEAFVPAKWTVRVVQGEWPVYGNGLDSSTRRSKKSPSTFCPSQRKRLCVSEMAAGNE